MYADPLVVAVAGGAAEGDLPLSRSFNRISISDTSAIYKVLGGMPGMPNTLKISHQETGKGSNKRVRHLVRLEANEVQNVPGIMVAGAGSESQVEGDPIASIYLVVDHPKGLENSTGLTILFRQFLGLLASGTESGYPDWTDSSALATFTASDAEFFSKFIQSML